MSGIDPHSGDREAHTDGVDGRRRAGFATPAPRQAEENAVIPTDVLIREQARTTSASGYARPNSSRQYDPIDHDHQQASIFYMPVTRIQDQSLAQRWERVSQSV